METFRPLDIWHARLYLHEHFPFVSQRLYNHLRTDIVKADIDPDVYEFPETFVPLSQWDVSALRTMRYLFHGFRNNLWQHPGNDIRNWDVSRVTDMSYVFCECETFDQPIGQWDVSKVTTMEGMFEHASHFNQPLDRWDVSNVRSMKRMFFTARAFNQPLPWNVSNVTTMEKMFLGTYAFNQPIGAWNVSNVTNMSEMFSVARSFNQPIGGWNVSKVTNMMEMFLGAYVFNQPLDGWNVSNVLYMFSMFECAEAFNQSLSAWNMSHNPAIVRIFAQCKKLTKLPFGWADDATGRYLRNANLIQAHHVFCNTPLFASFASANLSVYDFLHAVGSGYYASTMLHKYRGKHSNATRHRARTTALTTPAVLSHILGYLPGDSDIVKQLEIRQHNQDLANTNERLSPPTPSGEIVERGVGDLSRGGEGFAGNAQDEY